MIETPEISVLMPTFNDAKYIRNAMESLLNQSYKKWELIIIDDGSVDDTPTIINRFVDDRIIYLRQKNSGQLNALMNGAKFLRGKFVTILHSDDEFLDKMALERTISQLKSQNYDGVFADLYQMDEEGEVNGIARTVSFIDFFSPAVLFLNRGSNIASDVFFVKRVAFQNVISTYITWNMPYWLKFSEKTVAVLKLKKIKPWYKYRVYPENYARSDVGKFETVNGCLRTIIEISKRLNFPFLKLQKVGIKAFKRWSKPFFTQKPSSPKCLLDMIKLVLHSYYDEIPKNPYFEALLGFYTNFPSNRTINLQFKDTEEIFQGKDARIFLNLMNKNMLPSYLNFLLTEAANGFGKVIVTNRKDYQKAVDTMRFLNLLTSIVIE
ncbi:MAG: glycosyltransferase family 2 protein [Candidatus Bathyarchaeota archaeon]|jgi:glycosyltransferase involved in cell wall biosynthesis|nr:glycosyltransferase family 2 protein [Candidatus Bathyarchaeota archaeon A05DMB-5]MDH7557155.1 glycosyltransferase family 2 protein [Candidatus Bathyarchaeota archaeon]